MKNIPLSETQIEICDFTLKLDSGDDAYTKMYAHFDIKNNDHTISTGFLYKNDLLYSANPLQLTELGSRYSTNGIMKFIQDKRRNDFFNSPVLKFWVLLVPIFISLVFNVRNCTRTDRIESESPKSNYGNNKPDLLLEKPLKKEKNKAVFDSNQDVINDTIKTIHNKKNKIKSSPKI